MTDFANARVRRGRGGRSRCEVHRRASGTRRIAARCIARTWRVAAARTTAATRPTAPAAGAA